MSAAGSLEKEKQGEVCQRVCLEGLTCTNVLSKTSLRESATVSTDNYPDSSEKMAGAEVPSGVCSHPSEGATERPAAARQA